MNNERLRFWNAKPHSGEQGFADFVSGNIND